MDQATIEEMNEYLVMIFNEILLIEESSLKESEFSDLSIKEMHTIEAIGLTGTLSSSEVAKKLSITMGTLSVSIQNLVKKGYVERVSLPEDRRVVRLKLTQRGKLLYRLHRKFHLNMVEQTLNGLEDEEAAVLVKGLRNLHLFLDNIKAKLNQKDA
ncbi:MarR family transcriptional regulator [Aerococcaceae bacterium NML191292]|nr:MarR family transcriptional regulator [Aerococcaceae bacterium NML191292]MCW6661981.1 MarR family transcriptional regulator [Aerococcaceae bacterium NML201209]MCW6665387.1 MarR family transcriptional regulator [Aerococcaceae bacterium NML191219]MCW6675644.1 MarR family transcriptional regulator [Aerococcaceae bacterium NML171108]MCW6681175.1 MarR family transcriptional regulator [Aerococcaceae bacterium NML130460]MCW6683016.1 MarR family transcriptional regulator [Aerococcaceae bacterium NM